MLVKEIMTKNPKTLTTNTPISKVVEEMQRLDCGFMPIAENEKIVGVVTDRDITLRTIPMGKDPQKTSIKEIMTARTFSVSEDQNVNDAARKMCEQQIRRLVVLDKNNKITGVVSLGDIARRYKDPKMDSSIIEAVSAKKQFKKAA